MLNVMGRDTHTAWHANRSTLVRMLAADGQVACARDYAGYYLNAWRFFLSGYKDADAARESAACGVRVIECGIAVGRSATENHSGGQV
jgi:hypothetical protein